MPDHVVLPLAMSKSHSSNGMPTYQIHYEDRRTLPQQIEQRASELGLTPEQLIKRFISEGMRDYPCEPGPDIPVNTMDDYMVKHGVLKPKK